jgi:hypothetical protein
MGIFDFFKAKKPIPETKIIRIADVGKFIAEEKNKSRMKEKDCINLIKRDIKILCSEFEEEIAQINKIDLKERKVEEKIRLIVLENAKTLANYLKKLKENLEYLEAERLEDMAIKINGNFQEFKKRSNMSLQKTTYLIGKEVEAVIKTIDSFYEKMNEVLKNNEKLIENSRAIDRIEILNKEIKNSEGAEMQLNETANLTLDSKNELNEEIKKLGKNIEDVRASKEYLQKLENKTKFEQEKAEVKKEIGHLKTLLDLKELARIHHSSERSMKTIKDYSDNIHEAFEKDKGKLILELANENNRAKILEDINKILAKEKKISEFVHERDEIADIQKEIKFIESKIQETEDERARIEKRIFQSKDKIATLTAELAKEFEKINFKLEN